MKVEGASRDLNPVVREEAYRIAAEAMRNAVKHAQARQITVTLHYEARQLRLTVCDDGKGMDEETRQRQQRRRSLRAAGYAERATIVRGRLEVRTADRFRYGNRVARSRRDGVRVRTAIAVVVPAATAVTSPRLPTRLISVRTKIDFDVQVTPVDGVTSHGSSRSTVRDHGARRLRRCAHRPAPSAGRRCSVHGSHRYATALIGSSSNPYLRSRP